MLRRRALAQIACRRYLADLPALRASRAVDIEKLPEVLQRERFKQQLDDGACQLPRAAADGRSFSDGGLSSADALEAVDAGFLTFLLHVESRISSAVGQGFYTIGPCGEELLSATGLVLKPTDSTALHYRHLSTQIARQLRMGRVVDDLLLDRARGHVVSTLDPVTGGAHCSIGGGPTDFIVTSTLASQAPAAVGRALGVGLGARLSGLKKHGKKLKLAKDSVSYVSLGDGSVNNAHFLSAANFATYAAHRGYKCPVIFAITDNDRCISLRGYNWLTPFVQKLGMPVHIADGTDLLSTYEHSVAAIDSARRTQKPCVLVFQNVPRRFGHAATDRQEAYLSHEEIAADMAFNPLEGACARLVAEGVVTSEALAQRFSDFQGRVERAFDMAATEPKVESLEGGALAQVAMNSAPLACNYRAVAAGDDGQVETTTTTTTTTTKKKKGERPAVMRKLMRRVIAETLSSRPDAVYIGEDVEHGGYYLVSEGLATEFPGRVIDFPPDETALVGAGIGFAQAGLLPIVEIPYAKYLDCGYDQLEEACINYWLSAGRTPNGMLFRLQGFDRGVFGGNFHTHNTLHCPPGLDLVCYRCVSIVSSVMRA